MTNFDNKNFSIVQQQPTAMVINLSFGEQSLKSKINNQFTVCVCVFVIYQKSIINIDRSYQSINSINNTINNHERKKKYIVSIAVPEKKEEKRKKYVFDSTIFIHIDHDHNNDDNDDAH